jgi:hypothetical protein
MDAVFNMISRHISSLAMPLGAVRAICLVARMPIGVAALPNPNILAQIFADRSIDSWGSCFVLGNSRYSAGRRNFAKTPVIPTASISLLIPDHRQIEPAKEIANVTPAWAPWGIADANWLPRPVMAANRREMPTIPVNIQLMTI